MASTYGNDLRLEEIGDGEQSGTWGATTNTNLELIAEALSFGTEAITTNADSHTTHITDGASDPGRSLYLKYTGALDSTCTITITPEAVSKVWYIENGTSGSQSIIISCGSGANVTIPTGQTKVVYSDGSGAMAEIGTLGVTNLNVSSGVTVGGNATVGGTLGVTGVLTGTSLDISGDVDIDGTTNLDAVDIDGAVQIDATVNVGVDDTGYDVKFFGDTASAYMQWDASADDLILGGAAGIVVPDGKLTLGSTAVTSTGAELNILDGVTSTATEINQLDAITRGSILYGNASGATARLAKGSANTVLTSDGTDISWAAAEGGPSYTRSTTAPGSPTAGDFWLNTSSNNPSVFIYDGTLGWIQGDGTALGVAVYLAPNNFSLRNRQTGATIDVIRFEGVTPQIVIGASGYNVDGGSNVTVSNTVRGVIRAVSSTTNSYQFVVFANLAQAANFGNSTVAYFGYAGGISHATRGIFAGGQDASYSQSNQMEYITIATEGNATDFGNLTQARDQLNHACVASTTRGIIMGGRVAGGAKTNVMDYVTIANTGNATDFGDLTQSKAYVFSAHSTTRGLRMGGVADNNVIDYITMASAGNATDFGDLLTSTNSQYMNVVHNGTYAYIDQYGAGGTGNKGKITMATTGNAVATTDGTSPFGVQDAGLIDSPNDHNMMKGWIAATG